MKTTDSAEAAVFQSKLAEALLLHLLPALRIVLPPRTRRLLAPGHEQHAGKTRVTFKHQQPVGQIWTAEAIGGIVAALVGNQT